MSINFDINEDRLWETIMELSQIGSVDGSGITRLSLTESDLKARKYITQLMKEAGLKVFVDEVGNVIGSLLGTDNSQPVVITGSHIDTVTQGGPFDGALGVLAGVEVLRTIKQEGIKLTHTLEVVSFTDEEGARFGTGFIGSRGMVGDLKEEHFYLTDVDGITYAEAFKQAGFNPEKYKKAIRKSDEIKAYVELHIEQGEVLEMEDMSVGIVTDVRGPILLNVSFTGQTNHAGTTPMSIRRDASLAMAESLPLIEKIAVKWEGVATVGKMNFKPGGSNIIPETVEFTVDFRHTDKIIRRHMKKEIIKSLNQIAEKRGIEVQVTVMLDVDPVSCSPNVIKHIEAAFLHNSLPVYKMKCGAGHDALLLGKITDFGIIFIRSKAGKSHHPTEWSCKEDCGKGAQILLHTLAKLAE